MILIPRRTILIPALLVAAATFAAAPSAVAWADVEAAGNAAAAAANEAADAHDAALEENAHGDEHDAEASLLRGPAEGLITALTTFIVFVALVVILGKYAWGPIASGLKAREDKIRQDIAEAEAARARAEATLRDYNARLAGAEQQIRDMLAKATADGETIATNIRMGAQRDAEEIKEKAQREIEAARDQAVAQLHEEAVNLATNIAEKIVRRNLNPQDQRDLLAGSLEQLHGVGAR